MGRAASLLAAVLGTIAVAAPVRAPATGMLCPAPQRVPGIGLACAEPGGWRVILPSGGTVFTHGHDALPLTPPPAVTPQTPACVTDARQFHGLAIYVHAINRPNRHPAMEADIRAQLAWANGKLREEAAEFGRELNYRMLCQNGVPVVRNVTLPVPEEATDFSVVVNELKLQGYTSPRAKYWIFYDGHPPGAPGGTGTFENDASVWMGNRNNFGPSYGVNWGYPSWWSGGFIMMHENGHNMGAVSNRSLHSSGAGHCNDGQDVMCYADGGPSSRYNPWVCPVQHFDCNHDDYFHPAPPPGHVLERQWNLASAMNRFVAGCIYASGTVDPGVAVEVSIPAGCAGRTFALSAVAVLPASPLPLVSGEAARPNLPNADVCWVGGSADGTCASAPGPDVGIIPADATGATIVLSAGLPGTYVFSAV